MTVRKSRGRGHGRSSGRRVRAAVSVGQEDFGQSVTGRRDFSSFDPYGTAGFLQLHMMLLFLCESVVQTLRDCTER